MKEITIIVSGGVVQDVKNVPVGVTVKVIDYDVNGSDRYELVDGEPAVVSLYEGSK